MTQKFCASCVEEKPIKLTRRWGRLWWLCESCDATMAGGRYPDFSMPGPVLNTFRPRPIYLEDVESGRLCFEAFFSGRRQPQWLVRPVAFTCL